MTPGDGVTTIFGDPVAPDVAMQPRVGRDAGPVPVDRTDRFVVASMSSGVTVPGAAFSHPATTTFPLASRATARSRSRSHSGRSQRRGSTDAPSFQAPNPEKRCSGELRSATTTTSSWPTPRSVEEVRDLVRARFQLLPGDGLLAAVLRREHDRDVVVGVLGGQHGEPAPVRDLVGFLIGHAPALSGSARTSGDARCTRR